VTEAVELETFDNDLYNQSLSVNPESIRIYLISMYNDFYTYVTGCIAGL